MVDAMKASGWKITWMEWVCISGMMAGCTKDNTKMTKSMVLVFTRGLMVAAMKAIGLKVSSTV